MFSGDPERVSGAFSFFLCNKDFCDVGISLFDVIADFFAEIAYDKNEFPDAGVNKLVNNKGKDGFLGYRD